MTWAYQQLSINFPYIINNIQNHVQSLKDDLHSVAEEAMLREGDPVWGGYPSREQLNSHC